MEVDKEVIMVEGVAIGVGVGEEEGGVVEEGGVHEDSMSEWSRSARSVCLLSA